MIIKEPFNTYLARGRFFSPSSYKNARTPAEVWWKMEHPPKQGNPDFIFGHAAHTIMLEPELFETSIEIDNKEKYPVQDFNEDGSICMRWERNKQYRVKLQMWCQMTNKELLTDIQYRHIKGMKEAYPKFNPVTSQTLLDPDGAMIETSFYGKAIFSDKGIFESFGDIPDLDYMPEKNELLVKTRPDYLKPDTYYLDIKTCKSAYPPFFASDCLDLGYDIQVAFITDFCNFMLGSSVDLFILLAMEKKEPYQSVPMKCTSGMITTGRAKYQTRLEKIHAGSNKGYLVYSQNPDDVFINIPFPKYATLTADDVINW